MKKIVIQVHMESDKIRSKALKIAAAFQGVISVSLEGENRDQIVVIGEIDCVCLTKKLQKKFCHAKLLSVEDANVSPSNEGGEIGEEQKDDNSIEKISVVYYDKHYPPPYPSYYIVYDPYPTSCSIL